MSRFPRAALLLSALAAATAVRAQRTSSPLADARRAAGTRVALDAPPARTLCGHPREAWLRARLGRALPPCDAPGVQLTLRAVDRTMDRLDVLLPRLDGGVSEARAWLFSDDEVLAIDDPRAYALAGDPPRSPADAWRAALAAVSRPGCTLALENAPAGLGAAWDALPSGVYAGARGTSLHALVWLTCSHDGGAFEYVLLRVVPGAGSATRVLEIERFCRGVRGCPTPPRSAM